MRRRRQPRPSRGGMTLLELLIAVSVSALIAAAALGVYLLVTQTLRRQQEWRWTWQPAAAALDLMRHDLACSILPATEPAAPFLLEQRAVGTNLSSVLSLGTARATPGQDTLRRFDLWRVVYELRYDPAVPEEGGELVRTAQALTGPDVHQPAAAGTLARQVRNMDIVVYDGQVWTNGWNSAARGGLPRAARIRLVLPNAAAADRSLETEIAIPAGTTIRSAGSSGSPHGGSDPAGRRSAARQTAVPPGPGRSPP